MDKIELICTGGPYGDCTSSYVFKINREMTFQDFLDLVISNPREWGSIIESKTGSILADYEYGKITSLRVKDTSFIIETTGQANGGWSSMDYTINRKKKNIKITDWLTRGIPKKQLEQEKQEAIMAADLELLSEDSLSFDELAKKMVAIGYQRVRHKP